MTFETKQIVLTTAADLSADADLVAAGPDEPLGGYTFVQNSGDAVVFWRETVGAPDPATDRGHPLAAGDGVVVRLLSAPSFWVWSAGGEGEITISAASPAPIREV